MEKISSSKVNVINILRFQEIDVDNIAKKLTSLNFHGEEGELTKDNITISLSKEEKMIKVTFEENFEEQETFLRELLNQTEEFEMVEVGYGEIHMIELPEKFHEPINDIVNVSPAVNIEGIDTFNDFSVEFTFIDANDIFLYTNVQTMSGENDGGNIVITIGANKFIESREKKKPIFEQLKDRAINHYNKVINNERVK